MTERQRFPQGVQIGGPPATCEADHFYVCDACKQAVDMRDLGQVFHHEEPGHKPIPNDDAGVDVPRAPGPAPEDSYPDQTVLHDERNVGNCLQATIAGVLGWPLAAVPHFALLGEDHWWDCAQAWLDSQGYWIDYQPTSYAKEGGELLPRCWLSGRSPRGFSHAVIGDTTTLQVLHDPHPTRAGLLAVDYTIYFFRKPANSQAIDPRFAAAHYQDGRDLTYGVNPSHGGKP